MLSCLATPTVHKKYNTENERDHVSNIQLIYSFPQLLRSVSTQKFRNLNLVPTSDPWTKYQRLARGRIFIAVVLQEDVDYVKLLAREDDLDKNRRLDEVSVLLPLHILFRRIALLRCIIRLSR